MCPDVCPGICNISHSNNYKNFYESKILYLQIEKSYKLLNWQPIWDFKTTVDRTVSWYKGYYEGINPIELCRDNLINFYKDIHD